MGRSITKADKNIVLDTNTILEVVKHMEFLGEDAGYGTQQLKQVLENSKNYTGSDDSKESAEILIQRVRDVEEVIIFNATHSSSNVWLGQPPASSPLIIMQNFEVQKASKDLDDEKIKSIRFDYAISEEGRFFRGYASTDTKAPPYEEKTVESLDRLFNAWLAEKYQIATKDGYLYTTDDEGNTVNQLNMVEVEKLFTSSAQEFKDYLYKTKKIDVISQQHEFPGESRLQKNNSEVDVKNGEDKKEKPGAAH